MSSAIAIRGFWSFDKSDYEPVSDGSREIQRSWIQKKNYLQGSASDWMPIIGAAFLGIHSECKIENWDGEAAFAINDEVIAIAHNIATTLFALLPKGTPPPDVIPEADGEICLSWSVDVTRMFSLSIGAHRNVNYAGQFGKSGGVHAWQPIDTSSQNALGESLEIIIKFIEKLYPTAADGSSARGNIK